MTAHRRKSRRDVPRQRDAFEQQMAALAYYEAHKQRTCEMFALDGAVMPDGRRRRCANRGATYLLMAGDTEACIHWHVFCAEHLGIFQETPSAKCEHGRTWPRVEYPLL